MAEYSRKNLLLRYFLHGILFSAIGLIMLMAWAFGLVILTAIGFIIGIIIGFILLFLIIGGINTILTTLIWDVSVKSDWKSLIAHGFVFSLLQLIAHIPAIIIQLISSDLVTMAILLIIYSFIDGFLARRVAGLWEEYPKETGEQV